MTLSKSVTRVLAPVIAMIVALAAFAAVSLNSVPSADAAPKVTIKTKGKLKKDQPVKIKLKGFPASTAVAVGFCPAKMTKPGGVGDCGSPPKGYSTLDQTNAKGALTVTLRAPKGNLGATNFPSAKCNKKQKCRVFASTIGATQVGARSAVVKY